MNTYSGFGTFTFAGKIATFQISLPLPTGTNDAYQYTYCNISNNDINGLIINMKRVVDNGSALPNTLLNYQTLSIPLTGVTAYNDGTNIAEPFNYNKNFVVIVFHDANTSIYNSNNLTLFNNLANIAAMPVASVTTVNPAAMGPTKTGFGALKKI